MIQVMIVEDDPMVREINHKFLNQIEGYSVVAMAGMLEEAKKIVRKSLPDLILLDIYLPKGNGLEFLKWLRKEELECDVILITADKSVKAIKQALRYGAIDYLIKPFTFERLQDTLNQYRKRKFRLFDGPEVEQKALDQYIFTSRRSDGIVEMVPSQDDLPKGLNQQTYYRIWKMIKKQWFNLSFTADEVADQMGLSRVTVRRYLEYMLSVEKLEMELEYGKVGRPLHQYKIK